MVLMVTYLWTEEAHIKFLEEHNDEGDTEYFTRLSDNAIKKRSRFHCAISIASRSRRPKKLTIVHHMTINQNSTSELLSFVLNTVYDFGFGYWFNNSLF
ncbi:unnamed protein product [Rhizophagus irregularis]|uniref:Uncharacterized protein n=1 Tax=Rhizophagus irregularis TaxID=588596 RepID=A0A916ELH0_9GLOM|nr:unnamed protein product [Rhizophagus irregularis]